MEAVSWRLVMNDFYKLILLLGEFLCGILCFDWHFLAASCQEKGRNACSKQHMPFQALNSVFIKKKKELKNKKQWSITYYAVIWKQHQKWNTFRACNIFSSPKLNLAFPIFEIIMVWTFIPLTHTISFPNINALFS